MLTEKFGSLPKYWEFIPDTELLDSSVIPEDYVEIEQYMHTAKEFFGVKFATFIVSKLTRHISSGKSYVEKFSWLQIANIPDLDIEIKKLFGEASVFLKTMAINDNAQSAMASFFLSKEF